MTRDILISEDVAISVALLGTSVLSRSLWVICCKKEDVGRSCDRLVNVSRLQS